MKMKIQSILMAASAGLAGLLVAGVGPQSTPLAPAFALASEDIQHKSVLQLSDVSLPAERTVRIARNKSMMIEFPRALRDVVISDPEMVDAVVQSSNRVYLIAKKTGQANAFFFDASGERILTLEITVDVDTAPLAQMLKRLIPDSDITVEMLNDTVILSGTVLRAADSTQARHISARFAVPEGGGGNTTSPNKVVNLISVLGKEQVMLKVTISEIDREIIKRLGVNWNAASFGNRSLNFGTNNGFPVSNASGQSSFLLGGAGSTPGSCLTPGTNVLVANAALAAIPINCILSNVEAFERHGVLRTLAEPTLTAISGETASFLAGGEFPIPVGQNDGEISIEFKPFGVGLSFTPLVLSENRISLKINTEVSELSTEGAITVGPIAIPALKVRRASTTVELPSGGSMVLAGLISDDTRQNIDSVPGLTNLPILGSLFRSRDYKKKETELVVIVTPYIVQPVRRNKLGRPDDNWMPASDGKANFLGHMNRIYGRDEDIPAGDYKGDVGFIIE